MASTIRQRLRRFNGTDYDTVHLETHANNVLVDVSFVNPLNTDQLTLGDGTVYFKAYPDLKWQVQHLDGDYVYLALTTMTELTPFDPNSKQYTYAGSVISTKCINFLNNAIPNVVDYLENVTVNGVTAKVFIPSYKMFSGTASSDGGDANDPTFDWPSTSATNRICNYQGSASQYWLSSRNWVATIWNVDSAGDFDHYGPTNSRGFRPCVKVRYKNSSGTVETDTLDHVLSTIGGATDARTGEPLKLYSIPSDYAMIETVGTLPTFSSGNSPTSIIQYKDEAYALYVTFTNTTMSMELQKINMNTLNSYTGKLFTGTASSSLSQGSSNIYYYYMGCGVIGLAYRTNSTGALTYLAYDCKYTNTTGSMIEFPNAWYSYSGTYYKTFATNNYIVEVDTNGASPSHTIKYHNRATSTSRSSPNFTTFSFTLSDSRSGKSSYYTPNNIPGTNGSTLYFWYHATNYPASYDYAGFVVFSYTIGNSSIVELYRNTDSSIHMNDIRVLPWDQSKCLYCWMKTISSGVYEYHQELRTLPGFEPVSGSASIVDSTTQNALYPWYSDTAYDYYIASYSSNNTIYTCEKGTLNLVGTRKFNGVDTTVYSRPIVMIATESVSGNYGIARPQFSYDTRYGMYPFPNYVYTSNNTTNIKTATTLPGVAYMAYDDSPMPRSGYFYGLASGRQLQRTQWDKYVVGSVTAL